MIRLLSSLLLFTILGVTSGCTTAAVAVIDEKVSQVMEEDCSTVNVMLGESYCRPRLKELVQEQVYCYRTLGGVDCYARENPYQTNASPRVRPQEALGTTGARVVDMSEVAVDPARETDGYVEASYGKAEAD
ncbi:hypothetical protein [Sneathiella chinensis]|uniref:Lipoprotein n=1 Tax=Sneathiella chinensis TaxID=349750 RepID=A0ABQ5U4Q4_9PROT|nr:hypothetical protein [Sneathiella chinensis]GLQ05456.1 hypothetical protein GCM10007924_06770 [Sneathiella chinensis]